MWQVVAESTRLHEKLDFGEAGRTLYEFFWGDFADWYIEVRSSLLPLQISNQVVDRQR